MPFTNEQLERYSRHIILKEIGVKGQKKLMKGSVLIIGAGGLGAPAAMYLAAAGVGRIGIADADTVDLSNLQRQVIHTTADLGKPKVESAAETMRAINPDVEVKTYREFISASNILDIIDGYDFVLDGTDNFPAKFLINDACVMKKIPFCPPPKDAVPTCKQAGVIGAMAGVIGCLQALEAVKYLTGAGQLLTGRLMTFDGLKMEWHTVKLPPRGEGCAVCSDHPTITKLIDYEQAVCAWDPKNPEK